MQFVPIEVCVRRLNQDPFQKHKMLFLQASARAGRATVMPDTVGNFAIVSNVRSK